MLITSCTTSAINARPSMPSVQRDMAELGSCFAHAANSNSAVVAPMEICIILLSRDGHSVDQHIKPCKRLKSSSLVTQNSSDMVIRDPAACELGGVRT